MKIVFDSVGVLFKKYESFEGLANEHIDYESKHGRSVPNFNYEDWIRELVFFLLVVVVADIQSRRDLNGVEWRHKELIAKLDEMKNSNSVPSADIANTILKYATENDIDIEVQSETEVEKELWDTFQEMTRSKAIRIEHDHGQSLAGSLNKYKNEDIASCEWAEKTAWEDQTAEEWKSQN